MECQPPCVCFTWSGTSTFWRLAGRGSCKSEQLRGVVGGSCSCRGSDRLEGPEEPWKHRPTRASKVPSRSDGWLIARWPAPMMLPQVSRVGTQPYQLRAWRHWPTLLKVGGLPQSSTVCFSSYQVGRSKRPNQACCYVSLWHTAFSMLP